MPALKVCSLEKTGLRLKCSSVTCPLCELLSLRLIFFLFREKRKRGGGRHNGIRQAELSSQNKRPPGNAGHSVGAQNVSFPLHSLNKKWCYQLWEIQRRMWSGPTPGQVPTLQVVDTDDSNRGHL